MGHVRVLGMDESPFLEGYSLCREDGIACSSWVGLPDRAEWEMEEEGILELRESDFRFDFTFEL